MSAVKKRTKSKPQIVRSIVDVGGRKCVRTFEDLAKQIGAEEDDLRLLMKAPGCPKRNKAHYYDVESWRDFVKVSAESLAEIKDEANGKADDKKEWDKRKVAAQARILELQEAEKRGSLCSQEEVIQTVGALLQNLSRELMQKPKAMAADLAGLELPAFTKRLGQVHQDAIEGVLKGISVKKKPFWEALYAALSSQLRNVTLGNGLNAT